MQKYVYNEEILVGIFYGYIQNINPYHVGTID